MLIVAAILDRSGSTPRITYRPGADGAPQVQNCSTLVLAFPPTLAALGAAGLDLTPDEAAVFGAIALLSVILVLLIRPRTEVELRTESATDGRG